MGGYKHTNKQSSILKTCDMVGVDYDNINEMINRKSTNLQICQNFISIKQTKYWECRRWIHLFVWLALPFLQREKKKSVERENQIISKLTVLFFDYFFFKFEVSICLLHKIPKLGRARTLTTNILTTARDEVEPRGSQ